jgi:CheY-like chemotaxis protein
MCRILVADDNWQQLELRKLLLEAVGHQVAVAWSVRETMRQVELGTAELVIMDLRFPNGAGEPDAGEGLALIRQIRECGCRVPLIVLSGWPQELYGSPEESMVSRVMLKPVKASVLLETIAELVG